MCPFQAALGEQAGAGPSDAVRVSAPGRERGKGARTEAYRLRGHRSPAQRGQAQQRRRHRGTPARPRRPHSYLGARGHPSRPRLPQRRPRPAARAGGGPLVAWGTRERRGAPAGARRDGPGPRGPGRLVGRAPAAAARHGPRAHVRAVSQVQDCTRALGPARSPGPNRPLAVPLQAAESARCAGPPVKG